MNTLVHEEEFWFSEMEQVIPEGCRQTATSTILRFRRKLDTGDSLVCVLCQYLCLCFRCLCQQL